LPTLPMIHSECFTEQLQLQTFGIGIWNVFSK
jgi:hypothetical protein